MEPTHFLLDIDGVLRAGPINQLPGLEIIQHYMERTTKEKLPLISLCTGRGRGFGEAMHQNIGAPDTFSIFENGCFIEKITSMPRAFIEHEKVKENRDLFAQIASFLADYVTKQGYYREPKEVMVTISVKGTNKSASELETQIREKLSTHNKTWLAQVEITHSTTAVDITPQGVSKASGVELFAKHQRLDTRNICGVGDSKADCEFLELVGFAGCPSNAEKPVIDVVKKKIKESGSDHGFVAHRPDIFGVVEILEYFTQLKNVHLLETLLPSLREVQAVRERATFIATRARKKQWDPGFAMYEIDEQPQVAVTDDQRKLLECPTDTAYGTYWRWPAGGVLFVLKDRTGYFCPVLLRDQEAPADKWCFGTGAGVGNSEGEFLFPNRVALREAAEEVIICVGSKIAYPWIVNDTWGVMNLALEEIARKNLILASRIGRHQVSDIIPLKANLLSLDRSYRFAVKWGDKTTELSGLLVQDQSIGAVDYLGAIEIDLAEYPVDVVVLLDGEIKRASPLFREVYLFQLENSSLPSGYKLGNLKNVFQHGVSIKEIRPWKDWSECKSKRDFGLTPGLKTILESLRQL